MNRKLFVKRRQPLKLAAAGGMAYAFGRLPDAVYAQAGDGRSGLGIARIAYEGRCGLECDESVPGRVTVTARCPRAAFGD